MGIFGKKFENFFTNQQKPKEEMETKRTKEEAQLELNEKFGLKKTSDFQLALQEGKIELAKNWLNYIAENKENFPQYLANWENWLNDRKKELAQQELFEEFGLRKTSDFQSALQQGEIELAKNWLNYIIENKSSFPQYLATWDSWLNDRQRELAEAKK